MGVSGAYECAGIHTHDRKRAIYGRLHVEPGIQRFSGDFGPDLRSAVRACLPSGTSGWESGGDLPVETGRGGSSRRYLGPAAEDSGEEKWKARSLRGRGTGFADRGERSDAAG